MGTEAVDFCSEAAADRLQVPSTRTREFRSSALCGFHARNDRGGEETMNHRISQRPASTEVGVTQERGTTTFVLFTPKEAATRLRVSESFLAKARMNGSGPPYVKVGRSIRYSEAALVSWMRSRQRSSTSE
jgi:Helix-turn-helix domain